MACNTHYFHHLNYVSKYLSTLKDQLAEEHVWIKWSRDLILQKQQANFILAVWHQPITLSSADIFQAHP